MKFEEVLTALRKVYGDNLIGRLFAEEIEEERYDDRKLELEKANYFQG